MPTAIHAQESRTATAEEIATATAELKAMELTKVAESLCESGHET